MRRKARGKIGERRKVDGLTFSAANSSRWRAGAMAATGLRVSHLSP